MNSAKMHVCSASLVLTWACASEDGQLGTMRDAAAPEAAVATRDSPAPDDASSIDGASAEATVLDAGSATPIEPDPALPNVSEAIPSTDDSYAFGAAAHMRKPIDLTSQGYVEEEFVLSGQANIYDWPANQGGLAVRTQLAPYATRVLVRRPTDGARFSGRVVVELLNPTNLYDLQIGWALSHVHFMAHGDAWVGVTSKPIAVVALKKFNAQRYVDVSWANPLPTTSSLNCTDVPADSTRATENGLIWDMFSHVGRVVRSQALQNQRLLGGLHAKRVYAFGYSQSGGFLDTYIAGRHAIDVTDTGKPVFDAYLVGTFVGLAPLHQCASALPASDARSQLRNVDVPLMRIMTQSDFVIADGEQDKQGDVPPAAYRLYEVAGAGHATPDELDYGPTEADVTKAGVMPPPASCNGRPRSRFPLGYVFDAAWENLDSWVVDGVPPPSSEPIEGGALGTTLDAQGNARGGLRTPYVDVPSSRWNANSDGLLGNFICYLSGNEEPLPHETLQSLYTSHEDYVGQVRDRTGALVQGRFLTRVDGETIIAEAAAAQVP